MVRLFFAACIPEGAVHAVRRVQGRLRDATKGAALTWADPAQAHVTLKFLGEVADERLEALRATGTTLEALVGPFSVSLAGIGAFPDERRPRVVWVGVKEGAAQLQRLALLLDQELSAEGFAKDDRAYSPHLTLARVKLRASEGATAQALAGWPDDPIAAWIVETFSLIKSTSTPAGVRYDPVFTFRLEG